MGIALREQIHQAAISFTTTGDNTVIAGVAGKVITIVSMVLVSTGTTNITVKDGTGGTALSGAMPLAAGVPLVLPPDPTVDWYQSAVAGNNFVLNQSGAVQISGTVWYVQN
jgi:hypothetical protein